MGAAAERFQHVPTPAGEISAAKSASESLFFPAASRAAAELVASDFLTSAASGNELNSATKLTETAYRNRRMKSRGTRNDCSKTETERRHSGSGRSFSLTFDFIFDMQNPCSC